MLGFPIRKSSDHSSVDSSPRLIAASYVLHRLLVPRHPPCALKNLATKMLASTVQFSNNNRTPSPTPPPATHQASRLVRTARTARERNKQQREPPGYPLCPSSQDPTAYLQLPTHHQPVPTHPNKGMDHHNPEGASDHVVLDTDDKRSDRTSQCSTHELHHRTFACEMGLNPHAPGTCVNSRHTAASCSLERR